MMDAVSSLIVRQMDLAAARHKVLAHNLANAGSTGFTPDTASFETALSKAGGAAPAQAGVSGSQAAASASAPASSVPAGAGVNAAAAGQGQDVPVYAPSAESIEMQMARLDDNTGRFSALARLLSIRERVYETALRGR